MRFKELFRKFFFFNDTATTEIYTLSLHDALPISKWSQNVKRFSVGGDPLSGGWKGDRKSTRLNSSHDQISYAVFCLKKKKEPHIVFPIHRLPGPDKSPCRALPH